MTPAELRSRAARLRSLAADLDADTVLLRSQAGAMRGLLQPLVGMSQRAWVGPAADDLERHVRKQGALVDEQADRLQRIAGQLVQKAADARSEARRLDAQAASDELAAVADGSVTPIAANLS